MELAKRLAAENELRAEALAGRSPGSPAIHLYCNPLNVFVLLKTKGRVPLFFGTGDDKNGIVFPGDEKALGKLLVPDKSLAFQALKIHDTVSGMTGFLVELELVVCKSSTGVWSVMSKASDPAFNLPLISGIKASCGISLANGKPYFNMLNYWQDVARSCRGSPLAAEPVAAFSSADMHLYIRWKEAHPLSSEPLLRFDSAVSSLTPSFSVSDENVYPFALAMEDLENRKCVAIAAGSEKVEELFAADFLGKALAAGKSVLIAAPDRNAAAALTTRLRSTPIGPFLPDRTFGDPNYSLPEEAKRILSTPIPVLPAAGQKAKEEYFLSKHDYLETSGSAKGLGILETGEDVLTGVNKFSFYHALRKTSFPLDVRNYSPVDFENDRRVLKLLAGNRYVATGPLKEKSLHSLKIRTASRPVFEALKNAIAKTRRDLEAFRSALKEAHTTEWGLGPLETVKDYRTARDQMLPLLEYNGFPLAFFTIAKDPEAMALALRLNATKERMDVLLESLSEYVKSIDLLSRPLRQYMENAKSRHWRERWFGRHSLKNLLRDKRDYAGFLADLAEYTACTDSYEKDLPACEKKFGLVLYSEGGPAKIIDSLEYIGNYNRLIAANPALKAADNPFVAKIFASLEFREGERQAIRTADLSLDAVTDDYRGLADFFASSFGETESTFAELDRALIRKSQVTWDEFQAFQTYLGLIDSASVTMKDGLQAYDAAGLPLENYANDYWYSLYKALALKRHARKGGLDTMLKALGAYLPYRDRDRFGTAFGQAKERIRRVWWDSADGEKARNTHKFAPFALASDFLGAYWNLAVTINPLQVLAADMLPLAGHPPFDYVLILEPRRFTDPDLQLLLAQGERAAVVTAKPGENDMRFATYPQISFTFAALYEGPLEYGVLSPDFINLLAFGFEECGYVLETATESKTPMPFSYLGKDGHRRCVIPSCLVGERHAETMIFGLNGILMALGLDPVVLIDSMPLVIDPKETVAKADREAESLGVLLTGNDYAKSR